jgi:hypothetical protein
MVPGATGTAEGLRRAAEHLARSHTVAIYDRRGFSRSQLGRPQDFDRRLDTAADDLRRQAWVCDHGQPPGVIADGAGVNWLTSSSRTLCLSSGSRVWWMDPSAIFRSQWNTFRGQRSGKAIARPPVVATRTTAPPPPSPADPGVLRSGVVALTGNQGFDLDSGQTDGERDIYRWSSDTLARMNGGLLEPMSGMPSKQACQAAEGWQARVGDLQAGQWLCVRTSDGRYGRLNIAAVGGTLKLAYTVWT